jgi:hypothetical protein
MIIWRVRIACWVPKATNARTGRVILIDLQLQQWLYERASMLRYTYISSLVTTGLVFPEHGTLVRKHVGEPPLKSIYNELYELLFLRLFVSTRALPSRYTTGYLQILYN